MRLLWLAAILASTVAVAAPALDAPGIHPALRRDVLDAARANVQSQLGKPVRFEVRQLRMIDGWAFLHASMQDAHGHPVSYAGTRYEDADRHGQKSSRYDALLQRSHGHWKVRVDSIGPTDVPWVNWSQAYGAPKALFDDDGIGR